MQNKMPTLNFSVLIIFLIYLHGLNTQTVGTIINGYKGYNTLEVGNINVFITSPHMGALAPTDIMDRQNVTVEGVVLDNLVIENDLNSRNIARAIRDELARLFKFYKGVDARPYFLYTDIMR